MIGERKWIVSPEADCVFEVDVLSNRNGLYILQGNSGRYSRMGNSIYATEREAILAAIAINQHRMAMMERQLA